MVLEIMRFADNCAGSLQSIVCLCRVEIVKPVYNGGGGCYCEGSIGSNL